MKTCLAGIVVVAGMQMAGLGTARAATLDFTNGYNPSYDSYGNGVGGSVDNWSGVAVVMSFGDPLSFGPPLPYVTDLGIWLKPTLSGGTNLRLVVYKGLPTMVDKNIVASTVLRLDDQNLEWDPNVMKRYHAPVLNSKFLTSNLSDKYFFGVEAYDYLFRPDPPIGDADPSPYGFDIGQSVTPPDPNGDPPDISGWAGTYGNWLDQGYGAGYVDTLSVNTNMAFTISLSSTPVPETSTVLAVALGGLALARLALRRRPDAVPGKAKSA